MSRFGPVCNALFDSCQPHLHQENPLESSLQRRQIAQRGAGYYDGERLQRKHTRGAPLAGAADADKIYNCRGTLCIQTRTQIFVPSLTMIYVHYYY